MKFSRSLFSAPGAEGRLKDLVLTFLRRGGFETQINVVDGSLLRRARERPEDYRDLVVRIGGYTDYFARLSREMQDEIVLRTEYGSV
jgi:trans-4-hydroxy-L-proline dehydratase